MRRVLAIALLALTAPASAEAFFPAGATVMSASPARQELADDGSQVSVVSGDGRYVAFQTRATNLFADDDPDPPGTDRLGGVFRRDAGNGTLEFVAAGDLVDEDDASPITLGARNPSISADGRYVSFSTAYDLVPADSNGAFDVYVRDMSRPPADPAAYELISGGIGYASSANPAGQRFGSETWPVTSMSADGRFVAYRTIVASDLGGPNTPPGQLMVRDRIAKTVRLVTRTPLAAPAGGAAGPIALSADGSTIVWAGGNADDQTRFLQGEPYFDVDNYYLWQRLSDGPTAPTRRITGLVDLDDPGCAANSTFANDPGRTGPCYGPLTTTDGGQASIASRQIAISGDGNTVWYLTPGLRRPSFLSSGTLDLWRADMRSGVTRKQGALELTREGAASDAQSSPAIDGMAVTPDGRWLAISSFRTRFQNAALTLPGAARAIPNTREVYLADLSTNSLERVITSFTGTDASGDAGPQVSISADGTRIGLVSTASNLFFGDANNRPDAFLATRSQPLVEAPPEPTATPDDGPIYAPPDPPILKLRLIAKAGKPVVAVVRTPAAGALSLRLEGRLPKAGGGRSPLRVFATGKAKLKRKGTVRVKLPLKAPYRSALNSFKQLRASVRATFDPAGKGRKLVAARDVRLRAGRSQDGNKRPVRDRRVNEL